MATKTRSSAVTESHWLQHRFPWIGEAIRSDQFDFVLMVFIVLNSVTMGMDAERSIGKMQGAGWKTFLDASEHLFTFVFLVEFLLKAGFEGWQMFLPMPSTMWNFLDMLIVLVTGVFVVWVLPLLPIDGSHSGELRSLTILRACRLLRIARVLGKVDLLHEVWLLLRGLTESFNTLFWTVVVIFFITYIFAVFGVVTLGTELARQHEEMQNGDVAEPELVELVELVGYTNGVYSMVYTLLQVLTLDSWNGIVRPMKERVWWCWMYFYAYIAVAVIVLMNLVTAILVDKALNNAKLDDQTLVELKQQAQKEELEGFVEGFRHVDLDGDGALSWQEFMHLMEVKEIKTRLNMLNFTEADLYDLFRLLDNGDGTLTLSEFHEGLVRMEGPPLSKDSFRSLKTAELVEHLLDQASGELGQSLSEALRRRHGSGIPERAGTLKQRMAERAKRGAQASQGVEGAKGDNPTLDLRSLAAVDGETSHAGPEAEALRVLDVALGGLRECRKECNGGVEACTGRVRRLASELGELRGLLDNVLRGLGAATLRSPRSGHASLAASASPGPTALQSVGVTHRTSSGKESDPHPPAVFTLPPGAHARGDTQMEFR